MPARTSAPVRDELTSDLELVAVEALIRRPNAAHALIRKAPTARGRRPVSTIS
jgi:hypothetical protein